MIKRVEAVAVEPEMRMMDGGELGTDSQREIGVAVV